MKVCKDCRVAKPRNKNYFYRAKDMADGLMNTCIACRKKIGRINYFKRKKRNEKKRRKIKEAKMSIDDLIAKEIKDDRSNLLTLEKIENQKWELNQMYRVRTRKNKDGRKVHSRLGKLVEDHGNLVVFEFENGYKESFLKIDTILNLIEIKEVRRAS